MTTDPLPTNKYGMLMKRIRNKQFVLVLLTLTLMVIEDSIAATIARYTDIPILVISIGVCALFAGIITWLNKKV